VDGNARKLLAQARRRGIRVGWEDDRSYRIAASGDWRVLFYDPPLRSFQIQPPRSVGQKIFPPKKIQFFSEGKDKVILRPSGAALMAFSFELPEGMRPVREPSQKKSPIHFQDADVWVFEAGQVLKLEWTRRRLPGWLGVTPCFDSTGARVPISGTLHLPEHWVGVPSGNPIFRVGQDRAYGPFRQIQPGLWTSTQDPHPLALDLLSGIKTAIRKALGPEPRKIPHLIVESCGSCPRKEGEMPIRPRGESDTEVSWIRLGSPGFLTSRPGPLQTEPLQSWIPVEDGDPTALSLVHLYARALFPTSVLQGVSFLPPPTLSGSLLEIIRTWRRRSLKWESRALTDTILPGIFFECREMDRKGFDQAVRVLVNRGQAPLFDDLVEVLRRRAPPCLTPLRLRKLAD
jgi:hypothetical protein